MARGRRPRQRAVLDAGFDVHTVIDGVHPVTVLLAGRPIPPDLNVPNRYLRAG